MTDQEKALEGMIEFCKWLLPNAERFGLTESQSIKALSQAQTPDDIVNGMNSLYEEIGEEKFKALTHDFQTSKNIKKASVKTKIDYLVDKMAKGGRTENDRPRVAADTTFTKRWFPGEDGISYENTIHIIRWPYRDHDHPAARWQSQHEEHTEHITPENDTLYFNTFYDENPIGNKSNVYRTNENMRNLFDRFRNKNVWDDLGW